MDRLHSYDDHGVLLMVILDFILKEKTLLLIACGIICSAGFFAYGKYCGWNECDEIYKQQIEKSNAETTKAILEQERSFTDKQNEIVERYVNKVTELENKNKELNDRIDSFQFADTVRVPSSADKNCPRMPEKRVKPDLICYSKSELQRKIRETMAISEECDRLAERYNALLEVVTRGDI